MTKKTIKKILSAKINSWLNSIEDAEVRALARKNTIVTGGSIASMLMNEKVNDYDVYFKSREAVLAVAQYYCKRFNDLNPGRKNKLGIDVKAYVLDCNDVKQVAAEKAECRDAGHVLNLHKDRVKIVIRSDGVIAANKQITGDVFENAVEELDNADGADGNGLDQMEDQDYNPVFLSSNAITLKGRIQIVIRFFGDASEIHTNYDFAHCTNHYDHAENDLVLRPEALECILAKELRYQGSKYPLCSVIRTRKFIKRGFNINAGQYLKMLFQVSKLNLTDLEVLEDQLVGVDSAYFGMLIEALRTKKEIDPSFDMNETYVASVIDRIF